MPTPYAGVAGALQSPSPQPAELRVPILNIPAGGDRGAAVWTQPFKTVADWVAFIAASLPTSPVGALLRVIVLTGGASLAKSVGCTRARVRLVAGGGGGAGAATGVTVGGGGAAGGYAELFTLTIPATWTYAIGPAGTAGSGSPTNGGDGGNTTFSDGVTLVTAFGGGGGKVGTFPLQGAAATISTNGTINGSGNPGDVPRNPGLNSGGGQGGSSLLGGAGGRVVLASSAANNGSPGTGYGAGGSGGCVITAGNAVGGPGTAGVVILEEYS